MIAAISKKARWADGLRRERRRWEASASARETGGAIRE